MLLCSLSCNNQSHEAEEFLGFFYRFKVDKLFSIERAIFPIKSIKYEYGLDQQGKEETVAIETKVLAETFTKQPTLHEYAANYNLSIEIKPPEATLEKRIVKVYKQGTDWLIEYHFIMKDSSWYLQETHDYSL